jgi:hypothetical protein
MKQELATSTQLPHPEIAHDMVETTKELAKLLGIAPAGGEARARKACQALPRLVLYSSCDITPQLCLSNSPIISIIGEAKLARELRLYI